MRQSPRQLSAESWGRYFSRLAEGDPARLVAVEVVVSGDAATRPARAGRRLREIVYDAVADVIEIAEGDPGEALALRHFICAPRSILVRDDEAASASEVLVEDASGVCTRIDVFAPPLARRTRRRVRRGRCRLAAPSRRAARRAAAFDARTATSGR